MTRLELQDFILEFLQASTSKGIWTAAQIQRHIATAQFKMFTMVANLYERFCWTQSLINEVADQTAYSLPVDMYRLLFLERVNDAVSGAALNNPYFLKAITSVNSEEIDFHRRTAPVGQVRPQDETFYTQGQKTFILIQPSVATLTGSLRLSYIFRPAEMTSDTHVPFQQTSGTGGAGKDNLEEFHDVIALYALEMALLKEANAVYQPISQRRLEREMELRRYLENINVADARFVHYVGDDEDTLGF